MTDLAHARAVAQVAQYVADEDRDGIPDSLAALLAVARSVKLRAEQRSNEKGMDDVLTVARELEARVSHEIRAFKRAHEAAKAEDAGYQKPLAISSLGQAAPLSKETEDRLRRAQAAVELQAAVKESKRGRSEQ